MIDMKRITAEALAALRQGWNRLSATQKIMTRGATLFAAVTIGATLIGGWAPAAIASDSTAAYTGTAVLSEFERLRASLDTTNGELELVRLRLERAESLIRYSSRYRIPADLSALVYDVSLREGIDPELGFRLVNIESGFNARAKSKANAYGLAQVQVATARFYEPQITVDQLYEPELNLEIGFRFLRDLLETYGDIRLALLAYNRGPSKINTIMQEGQDPDNGYPSVLMEGYTGSW
jgi:soluble lytic murein transglycosylase-like protein